MEIKLVISYDKDLHGAQITLDQDTFHSLDFGFIENLRELRAVMKDATNEIMMSLNEEGLPA